MMNLQEYQNAVDSLTTLSHVSQKSREALTHEITPEQYIKNAIIGFDERLKSASVYDIEQSLLPLINEHIKAFRQDDNLVQGLKNLRKRCYRVRDQLKPHEGTVSVPALLNRNITNTPESIRNDARFQQYGIVDHKGNALSPNDIADKYRNELQTIEAGYMLDGIHAIMKDHLNNSKNEHIDVDFSSNETLTITTTWKAFCAKAALFNEEHRKKVKAAMFSEGKRLLERIQFIRHEKDVTTKETQPYIYIKEFRFISVKEADYEKRPNALSNSAGTTVHKFQIDLPFAVWATVIQALDEKRYDPRVLIPQALTFRVHRAMQKYTSIRDKGYAIDDTRRPIVRNTNKFTYALLYLINVWHTGQQNRRAPRTFLWKELAQTHGLLPKRAHDKHGRVADMHALHALVEEFHTFFSEVERIEFDTRVTPPALVLHPVIKAVQPELIGFDE